MTKVEETVERYAPNEERMIVPLKPIEEWFDNKGITNEIKVIVPADPRSKVRMDGRQVIYQLLIHNNQVIKRGKNQKIMLMINTEIGTPYGYKKEWFSEDERYAQDGYDEFTGIQLTGSIIMKINEFYMYTDIIFHVVAPAQHGQQLILESIDVNLDKIKYMGREITLNNTEIKELQLEDTSLSKLDTLDVLNKNPQYQYSSEYKEALKKVKPLYIKLENELDENITKYIESVLLSNY